MTGHTRSSRRLPYSEVGPGPVDLEAVASMADLAAAAAVIAGPPGRDASVLCWLKQLS